MKQVALKLEKSFPKRIAVFVFALLSVLLFLKSARAQVAYPPPPIPTTPPAPTKALATPAEDHHATNQTCGCWKTYHRYPAPPVSLPTSPSPHQIERRPHFWHGCRKLGGAQVQGSLPTPGPGVYISTFFGYDFSHVLSLELGFNGSMHKEQTTPWEE